MKQAKSRTRKKFKKLPYERLGFSRGQIEQAAQATTAYLKDWTTRELKNIVLKEKIPVCIPIGDHGFLVGRYRVENVNGDCWRVLDNNHDEVHNFCRKLSAIYYCVASELKLYQLAQQLLTSDNTVSKLELDNDYFNHTIKVSLKKQDYFRADVAKLRQIHTVYELKPALEELQKTINIAKYLKVQERLS